LGRELGGTGIFVTTCAQWVADFRPLQSCATLEWVEKDDAQVVQTAWAVMGLMYAKYPHPEPIERAIKLVMSRQLPVRSL